ncbi:hypothetical protein HK100_011879 [Physocladia obscura]|uniref:60S ribosomal protein L6 n=1 Tax=Physocladia obscura TaxID=109957 RepID=A0AAD5TA20_9FUNG|nr:hypothetical protein HK100_011879 [Physocladia obscura]
MASTMTDQRLHPVKKIGRSKNGGSRVVSLTKADKYYLAEDVKIPKKPQKNPKPPVTGTSITPRTVLILVAGRYAGKDVVYLKSLESGLFYISGPIYSQSLSLTSHEFD